MPSLLLPKKSSSGTRTVEEVAYERIVAVTIREDGGEYAAAELYIEQRTEDDGDIDVACFELAPHFGVVEKFDDWARENEDMVGMKALGEDGAPVRLDTLGRSFVIPEAVTKYERHEGSGNQNDYWKVFVKGEEVAAALVPRHGSDPVESKVAESLRGLAD